MSWKDTDFGVSYARDLPYYTLQEMKKSVGRCHVLWGRQLPAYDTMYYLNPSKLYRSKTNRFIKRGEAVSYIVKISYGNFKDSSLDGYRFADTIFSNYRKEIDFAYNEFLDQKNEVYFRPEENLTNAELSDWIKSLNNS